MACSICGAEADLILLRRGPSGASDESLCENCARDRGLRARGGSIAIDFDVLLGDSSSARPGLSRCPVCGLDIAGLRKTRRLGCLNCLETFRGDIGQMLSIRRRTRNSAQRSASFPPASAILQGRLRGGRLYPGFPFPGHDAARLASDALSSFLQAAGYRLSRLHELSAVERLNLAVSAGAPAAWMAEGESLVGFKDGSPIVCLVECEDHLSFRTGVPQARIALVELELRRVLGEFDEMLVPVRDEEFGVISSSIAGCGEGLRAEILLHLPALEMSASLDRALKARLAEGWALEGILGAEVGSAGAMWILEAGEGLETDSAGLAVAAARLADSESTALRELASRAKDEILERAGRALGLVSMALSLSLAEALDSLSDLRLGSLAGLVPELKAEALGRLLLQCLAYGPGVGADTTIEKTRSPGAIARERARWIRSNLGIDEPFAMPGPFLKIEGGR